MNSVTRLQCAIELFVKYHPKALKILTGEIDPPADEEIAEILRLAGPRDEVEAIQISRITRYAESVIVLAEAFTTVIDLAGGWGQVVKATNEYRLMDPRNWSIFCDHLLWIDDPQGGAGSRLGDRYLSRLGRKYGVSPNTITRISQEVPKKICRMAFKANQATADCRQLQYSW